MWLVRVSSRLMKGAFDPDCSRLLQDCCTTAEMLHRSLWQQKQCRGKDEEEKRQHNSLQSLRDTLEFLLSDGRGKKKSLPQCRVEHQWAADLFSHPSYKAALTRLKKGSCPLPWRSLYYSADKSKTESHSNHFPVWHKSTKPLGGIFEVCFTHECTPEWDTAPLWNSTLQTSQVFMRFPFAVILGSTEICSTLETLLSLPTRNGAEWICTWLILHRRRTVDNCSSVSNWEMTVPSWQVM